MKLRHILLIFLVAIIATTGCYDGGYGSPTVEFTEQANCKIGSLRQMCEEGCATITTDLICVGRVVSTDFGGNFYHSLVVEDATGAVEVRIGLNNIATLYPIGLNVALRLKGHAIMVEDEVVTLGLPPMSHDESPRELAPLAIIDKLIVRSDDVTTIEPLQVAIPSLSNTLCGRYVEVAGLLHSPTEECTTEATMEGYHRFVDGEGNAIFTFASEYAKFKDDFLPTSAVTVRGILYRRVVSRELGDQFVIIPRTKDDFTTANSDL